MKTVPYKRPFSLRNFLFRWEWILVLLILVACLINSYLSPYFLDFDNLLNMTFNFMEKGLMTFSMTYIIVTGNIDLSVASTLAMTASIIGKLHQAGLNIWLAVGIGLSIGALAGLLNGLVITKLKVPALGATLGTFAFYRGLAWVIMEEKAVTGFPLEFITLGSSDFPGTPVPIPLFIYLLFFILFALILHKTTFGRRLYAIGGNKITSLYSGININKIILILYVVSGLMSAIAGVLMSSRFSSVRADIANGAELDIITSVLLGGVSIQGGSGSLVGVFLALFFLGIIRWGLNLINVRSQYQIILIGLLLILSVFLPRIINQIFSKSKRKEVKKI